MLRRKRVREEGLFRWDVCVRSRGPPDRLALRGGQLPDQPEVHAPTSARLVAESSRKEYEAICNPGDLSQQPAGWDARAAPDRGGTYELTAIAADPSRSEPVVVTVTEAGEATADVRLDAGGDVGTSGLSTSVTR